ncbi:MAG TPA: HlyD family efflux transporter periplasmic adaptor subunit [Terracidiphilus sp.]|nr:HlyD family efflux transporter periplasmic adaptor subunit [Terracidiphilus sp.]
MNSEMVTSEVPAKPKSTWPQRLARSSPRLWIALALAAAALFLLILLIVKRTSTHNPNPQDQRTARSLDTPSVRLNGKTEAVQSRAILAPLLAGQQVGTLTIVKLIPSGSRVKQGDILVEFDRATQIRDYIDKKAQADDQNGKVLEAIAAEVAAKAKDETELQQSQTALSKAELEMQKVELLSRIDAEKARETLDEARATLTQLKETFELKRQAAKASIRILEIQRDRTRETMLHAQNNASLMQIHSPIDGVIVFNTIWKQGNMGEVQEGDQVRPGVPFMQVVDPSLMQVHVLVNQQDLFALHVGQKASIHLDAYPDIVLPGRLESIDPMGKHGNFSSKLRVFSATFSINGSDSRLMPDLSAAVDVHAFSPAAAQGAGQ